MKMEFGRKRWFFHIFGHFTMKRINWSTMHLLAIIHVVSIFHWDQRTDLASFPFALTTKLFSLLSFNSGPYTDYYWCGSRARNKWMNRPKTIELYVCVRTVQKSRSSSDSSSSRIFVRFRRVHIRAHCRHTKWRISRCFIWTSTQSMIAASAQKSQ